MFRHTVYLCGPIGGCTFEECTRWRNTVAERLEPLVTLSPLRPFQIDGLTLSAYGDPVPGVVVDYPTRFIRDHDDVHSCDALLVNFLGAKRKSIGSAMEIAWAAERGIPMVVAMEPDNINNDLFMNFFVGEETIQPTLADAVNQLRGIFNLPKFEC